MPATQSPLFDQKDTNVQEHVMSFGDHLEELRRRLFAALIVPLPVAIIAFFFSNTLLNIVLLPVFRAQKTAGMEASIQMLSPPEMIIAKMKISFIVAILIGAPWILWQFWLFIRPGLYSRERRFVYLLIPGSAIMTVAGVLLMYYIMLPFMLVFLIGIGQSLETPPEQPDRDPAIQAIVDQQPVINLVFATPSSPEAGDAWLRIPDMIVEVAVADDDGVITVHEVIGPTKIGVVQNFQLAPTISFVLLLFLSIAIAFQMPIVLLLLGWLDLVSPQWLATQRKYALFGCGIVCAIITPPDVTSMIMMMAPLYGLFEFGMLLMKFLPASRVAAGLHRPSGKQPFTPGTTSDQSAQTTQTDSAVPRSSPDLTGDTDSHDGAVDDDNGPAS